MAVAVQQLFDGSNLFAVAGPLELQKACAHLALENHTLLTFKHIEHFFCGMLAWVAATMLGHLRIT